MISVTQPQKRALVAATIMAIAGGAYFLHFYFMLIVTAAIVAFMFNPLYQRLLKRWSKPGRAASVTLVCSFLVIVIPVILVLTLSVYQITGLVDSVTHSAFNGDFNELVQQFVDFCNRLFNSLGIPYQLSATTVINGITEALKAFGHNLLQGLGSSLSGFFEFFSTAIIYIYVFLSLLIKQDELISLFHQLNPLGKDISKLYTERIAAMTKAMVRGQFIIAATQGFTDALLLYLGGIHTGFIFFFLILTALSIIPLGGGVLVIPIGIVMILTGNVWGGVLVVAGHLLIVTNEDNVMRPKLVPKEARLDPALTLLAVFSGLKFFGFLGIIIGPVLMILIVTTIQVYIEVYGQIESVDRSKSNPKNHKLLGKLEFWKKDN